jgi:hypothetical protein
LVRRLAPTTDIHRVATPARWTGRASTNDPMWRGSVRSRWRRSRGGLRSVWWCAIWAARTYVGARFDGAGCLVGALAAAHSPTGQRRSSCQGHWERSASLSPIVWAWMFRTEFGRSGFLGFERRGFDG